MNRLYFGDNLDILRNHVKDESVDLIYLDPPFNSQARYNVLFKSPKDDAASAQVGAFLDFWSWESGEAEGAYHEIMTRVGGSAATFIQALRSALGESDMMAYLVMMCLRLVELRRVLRPSGSLYLHCDPTASHYLKLILDSVFGPDRFRNEIIWKRTAAHGGSKRWGPVHDAILFYTATNEYVWNRLFQDYDPSYLKDFYKERDDRGSFQLVSLTGAGVRTGDSGKPWKGIDPSLTGRHWAVPTRSLQAAYPDRDLAELTTQVKLDLLEQAGLVAWPERGSVPRQKRYSDENPGVPLQDIVTDIGPISSHSKERLGYPTQKPVTLLDRIIRASSRAGDTVLDPFCGCGTTIHAAEASQRNWIGIDVSIHAVHVIEARLHEAFGATRVPKAEGIPLDYESAARLARDNPFQFQWWANYLVGVHVLKEVKKGADRGIDGEVFFPNGPGRAYGRMLTSVKGGKNVGPAFVREFRGVIEREKAEMGLFICLDPPTAAMQKEAVVAGFADIVHGRMPRLQIVSVAEWFHGRRPAMPPLENLPYAAFSQPRRPAKGKRPDPSAPELPLSFSGGKDEGGVVRHINPRMVSPAQDRLAI